MSGVLPSSAVTSSAAASTARRGVRSREPFGVMTEADVERALSLPQLAGLKESGAFLREILRVDARFLRLKRGDIVVREGDYGHSVFLIAEGQARVLLAPDVSRSESGAGTGRERNRRRGWWGALHAMITRSRVPEARKWGADGETSVRVRGEAETARAFVRDVDAFFGDRPSAVLGPGEMMGEIAALSRSPRTATVIADSDLTLLELRWQGLRDIRQRVPAFRDSLDSLYRARSLISHLRESPLFAHLDEDTLALVARATTFEVHGQADWSTAFRLAEWRPGEGQSAEAQVVEEGGYVDGLLMVRHGFLRLFRRRDHGRETLGFASHNDLIGLPEIVAAMTRGEPLAYAHGASALGQVDLLRVPTSLVRDHVLPHLDIATIEDLCQRAPGAASSECRNSDPTLVDFLTGSRTLNGRAAMVINLDRCVGCDDCVRACAAGHDGNPRFVRQGVTHDNLQIAHACMHCVDPVCLIGCPTGAIHRDAATGTVRIDDPTCIGCTTCANACPYGNIQMVEIADPSAIHAATRKQESPCSKPPSATSAPSCPAGQPAREPAHKVPWRGWI